LRNAIRAYFKAEEEVLQANSDYYQKLETLRNSKPDIN